MMYIVDTLRVMTFVVVATILITHMEVEQEVEEEVH